MLISETVLGENYIKVRGKEPMFVMNVLKANIPYKFQ